MNVLNLTSSRFFGGPERQILGLAQATRNVFNTLLASFSENHLCRDFLNKASELGVTGIQLKHDTPHVVGAYQELVGLLFRESIDVLVCHGYKAGLLGLMASRRVQIPVVAVSRGWTAESLRVRCYEALDRRVLRRMDRVVCVSHAQADKVRRAGVSADRIVVIPNAIRPERFASRRPECRGEVESLFASPPRLIVGAAGRLSPEKGFDVLIEAASRVCREVPDVGFVLFGDGPLCEQLQRQIIALGLHGSFVLGRFRHDLDDLLPHVDVFVLPSHTEGLPNVVLESFAAGVPVVATAVGGTPEVIVDGDTGFLVPRGDAEALARRITELLGDVSMRSAQAAAASRRVRERFSFVSQAEAYQRLFDELTAGTVAHASPPPIFDHTLMEADKR